MKKTGCAEPEWYLCKDNSTCIAKNLRCNGRFDCPTEDDEEMCQFIPRYQVTECTRDEFKCHSDGACVPLEMVCDGKNHCFDGSDETIGCNRLKKMCDGFICDNGRCLTDQSWVCDG